MPVRFERASKTEPNIQYPDIDNRGFRNKVAAIDGHTLSNQPSSALLCLIAGQVATIKLVRETISPTAPLYITSSNADLLALITPSENTKCPDGPFSLINIKAQSINNNEPQMSTIEVRFGGIDGPIIHRLAVYVLTSLVVKIQPYLVKIDGKNGATGKPPSINLNKVIEIATAIWAGAGVQLSVAKPIALEASLVQANKVACNKHLNEINQLLSLKWEADRINLYIVKEVEGDNSYTINAQEYKYLKLEHPAIIFGLIVASTKNQHKSRADDAHQCGNDIAHELGHFFSLHHPVVQSENQIALQDTNQLHEQDHRLDTWSMRSLMYATNTTKREPPGSAPWQVFNDFGYGLKNDKEAYRGALIPIKQLGESVSDAHCIAARNYISQGSKHLYS